MITKIDRLTNRKVNKNPIVGFAIEIVSKNTIDESEYDDKKSTVFIDSIKLITTENRIEITNVNLKMNLCQPSVWIFMSSSHFFFVISNFRLATRFLVAINPYLVDSPD